MNKPNRPIPSGRISRSDAFYLSVVFFALGLAFSKSINRFCLGMGILNTMVLIIYARWGKKMLILSNVIVSYLVGSVFIFGSVAIFDETRFFSTTGVHLLLVMTAAAFLITLSREIIKDIEDMVGDKKAYSDTLPLRLGGDNAKKIAFVIAIVTCAISVLPIVWAPNLFNELLYGIIILATDISIIGSFTMSPAMNQRILVLSMPLALLAFLLGVSPAYIELWFR